MLQVGIDLIDRPDLVRLQSVARIILSADERRALLGREPLELAAIFSAKEAAIKALSPHLGRFIEFREIAARKSAGGYVLSHPDVAFRVHSRRRLVSDVLLTVAVMPPHGVAGA